jgi:acetyl-CoA carboxylase beta subunit
MSEIHFCPTCKTRRSRIEGKPAQCWLCATVIFEVVRNEAREAAISAHIDQWERERAQELADAQTFDEVDEFGNYPGEHDTHRLVRVEAA